MNCMGMKIAALVMDRMSKTKTPDTTTTVTTPSKNKGGKDAEQEPFEEVYKKISDELAEAAYMKVKKHQNRCLTFAFSVMKSFNSYHNGNPMLDTILLVFARIRLGFTPKKVDELGAAMLAIFLVYLNTVPGLKTVTGNGAWALPILHMLNDHMKHRRVTGISFHPNEETDEEKGATERASHCDLVIIEKTNCKVENRQCVIKQLQAFAVKFTNNN